jgi:hypothetical protein
VRNERVPTDETLRRVRFLLVEDSDSRGAERAGGRRRRAKEFLRGGGGPTTGSCGEAGCRMGGKESSVEEEKSGGKEVAWGNSPTGKSAHRKGEFCARLKKIHGHTRLTLAGPF